APPVIDAIKDGGLVSSAVLSGNRNFEGRVNPHTLANYLASPPLVVAYALAGTIDVDFATEPVGLDPNGAPVYLSELWPTHEEIAELIKTSLDAEMFAEEYGNVFDCNETWNAIRTPEGALFAWDDKSTYVQEPPFFKGLTKEVPPVRPIENARCLAMFGDSTTTDHISPAGAIAAESPAARYLEARGVERKDWNSYGSRRGNHEVMMRGTFANIRIRNELIPGVEGGFTKHLPSGEQLAIWDAAERYMQEDTALIVLAGKDYGMGSSRDWAAKGPQLQGLRAAIAESYERIHRSNLVGMGVLPLQFKEGEGRKSLGLTGTEHFTIEGLGEDITPGQTLTVLAKNADTGEEKRFETKVRIDTPVEVNYYKNGGILHTVLRRLAQEE
ncbi:MAG: aconitase family protein, partial [Planctomycetota bacterium]